MFQDHAFGEHHHPIGRDYEFISARFKIISNLIAFRYDHIFIDDRPFDTGTAMNFPPPLKLNHKPGRSCEHVREATESTVGHGCSL
jgi:hypothetical protein